MKKKLFALLASIYTLCICLPCVLADSTSEFMLDKAELLTEYEYETVNATLMEISEEYGYDTVIITSNGIGSADTKEEYCDRIYLRGDYSYDGMVLLIDYENLEFCIRPQGEFRDLSEYTYDYIQTAIMEPLQDGNFEKAFINFANCCDAIYSGDYDIESGETFKWGSSAAIALIIGFVCALITTAVMRGQLKNVHLQNYASNYVRSGSMTVTESRDTFLYRHITKTPRPKNNSGNSNSGRSGGSGSRSGSFR